MLEINYYADPRTSAETRAFRAQMRKNHDACRMIGQRLYPEYWRRGRGNRRRNWVQRLRELGVLDPPRL